MGPSLQVASGHPIHHARWGKPGKTKWCADTPRDMSPWIMVGFGSWPKYLSKIRHKSDVQGYGLLIEISLDGKHWTTYESHVRARYFSTICCNLHKEEIVQPPAKSRFIRFAFKRSSRSGPYKACLMFELFGCSAETQTLSWFPPWLTRTRVTPWLSPALKERKNFRLLSMSEDPYFSYCFSPSKKYYDFGNPSRKQITHNEASFDMGRIFALTKVVIKPDLYTSKDCGSFTKELIIMYGMDSETWTMIRHYNGRDDWRLRPKIHPAIQGLCEWATIDVIPTAIGRFFRFIPGDYYLHQCLKIEMIGFEPGAQPRPPRTPRKTTPACNAALGMKSGAIKQKMITATSSLGGAQATNGRLTLSRGWCVAKVHHVYMYTAVNNSLDIDLRKEHIIDGFASQGHSDDQLGRWVTAYVVHYSLDGVSWDIISTREHERVFLGNRDCCSEVRHYLNPRIRARFIRFVPVAWNKWPCMRVEVYGCSDGTSYKSRLFEKLRDIETQKLSLVHLSPNSKLSFDCGDYETWGHTNYLKINLDRRKSVWYQKAFDKDFPLMEKTLTLSSNQFPSDFGHRHFMCIGRTRDGMDIFRQHLIAVPEGPRNPTWLLWPISEMKTNPSSAIPQIIVIQRFDDAYDGGFPVWSEPAIVKASGNKASLAVFVLGIPYYPMIVHHCLVEDRLTDWRLTHLGTVPRNDLHACARLALSRGYDYMILLSETECMTNWYMPLATSPHRARDEGQCRLEPKAYFIQATFEEYHIAWYKKVDDERDPWKQLFSYAIKPRYKSTSHIFSVATDPQPDKERQKRYSYFGQYQTFDKALFGDSYTGSHVMDIREFTLEDLGAYKFEVTVPFRGVKNEAVMELRHEKEPRIDLPERYGACEGVPGPITVQALDDDLLDPEQYQVDDWFDALFIGHEFHHWSHSMNIDFKTKGKWNETFVWTWPESGKNGEYFGVYVKNRYGLTTALAQIDVASKDETPFPEWVTPSPFQAVDGIAQILEVKLRTYKQLESVTWFHDNQPIEVATDRYAFPESTAGIRTKLKLITIDEKTPGKYKVLIKGKSCQFEKVIDVKVLVIPRVFFLPRADYVIAKVNDKQMIFNATVKGGDPKPKLQQMTWRKGNTRLIPSHSGRIVLFTTLDENNNWFTVLKIRLLRVSDSGQYTFEVRSGPATTKQSWRLSVRSGTLNTTLSPGTGLTLATEQTTAKASDHYRNHPAVTAFLAIFSLLSAWTM